MSVLITDGPGGHPEAAPDAKLGLPPPPAGSGVRSARGSVGAAASSSGGCGVEPRSEQSLPRAWTSGSGAGAHCGSGARRGGAGPTSTSSSVGDGHGGGAPLDGPRPEPAHACLAVRVAHDPQRSCSSEAPSSVCETVSDLSALASPLAYAERLRGRLERHAGGTAEAGVGAAGAAAAPVTAEAAAEQLDRFLEGHAALKLQAERLGEAARQRRQRQRESIAPGRLPGAGAGAADVGAAPAGTGAGPVPGRRRRSSLCSSSADEPPLTPVSGAARLVARLDRHLPPPSDGGDAPCGRWRASSAGAGAAAAAGAPAPAPAPPAATDARRAAAEERCLFLLELQHDLEASLGRR
jgi:hypothetical protein